MHEEKEETAMGSKSHERLLLRKDVGCGSARETYLALTLADAPSDVATLRSTLLSLLLLHLHLHPALRTFTMVKAIRGACILFCRL